MNEQIFWKIIELAQQKSGGNMMVHIELIIDDLSSYTVSELYQFDQIYHWLLDKANEADLWGAGYVLCNGCDSDEFVHFRNWLMLLGQSYFKKAIADPEILVSFVPFFQHNSEILNATAELSSVADQAYSIITDEYNFYQNHPFDIKPTQVRGELWKNQYDLADKLPLLCHNMGWGNPLYKGNWVSDE